MSKAGAPATRSVPSTIVGVASAAGIAVSTATLGGLAVAAVATMAAASAPILLFLAPVLVPIAALISVATCASLGLAAAALASAAAVSWIRNRRRPGPKLRHTAEDSAGAVKGKAEEAMQATKQVSGHTEETSLRTVPPAPAPAPAPTASSTENTKGRKTGGGNSSTRQSHQQRHGRDQSPRSTEETHQHQHSAG